MIGQSDLFEEVGYPLLRTNRGPRHGVSVSRYKTVDANLHTDLGNQLGSQRKYELEGEELDPSASIFQSNLLIAETPINELLHGIMKKVLYLIPGFGESTQDKPYRTIASAAKASGYEVVMYSPKWSRAVVTQWVDGLKALLPPKKQGEVTVLGFSFGAFVALNTAKDFPFDKIIVCSMPPFFKGDIKDMEIGTKEFLGKRRMNDLQKHEFPRSLKTPITFMNGEKEDADDIKKMLGYHAAWSGKKKKILVAGAEHDLETGTYLSEIIKELTDSR